MMWKRRLARVWLGALLWALLVALCTSPRTLAADRLGAYGADPNGISVSGLSSGGYMAQQYHVAHSRQIMGAGIFAAGPWECADSVAFSLPLATAMTVCSHTAPGLTVFPGPPDVDFSIRATHDAAKQHHIDPVESLARAKVFLFSGKNDTPVPRPIVDTLRQYYLAFLPLNQIKYITDIPAEHAMPTEGYGNACGYLGTPYINDCHYDGAGEMLQFLYGTLNPPGDPSSGELLAFDQSEFLPADPIGMAPVGHVFVPADCRTASGCRLHVAFHGCEQTEQEIGDKFYAHAGYNRWAATNRLIVVYPQIVATDLVPFNPKGCWDWFAYNNSDFATKRGAQIVAVSRMIDRVIRTSPP